MEEQFRPDSDPFAKQLKPRKRRSAWAYIGFSALAIAIAAGAFVGFAPSMKPLRDNKSNLLPIIEAHQDPDFIFTSAGSDKVNILLIGRDVDYREVYDKEGRNVSHEVIPTSNARSDSMIVLSIDKSARTVRLVSLPRDAIVNMPPNKFHNGLAKLNAAHAYGGPKMLERAIHDELGLTIQRYAEFKFDGFKNLIDQVGGVTVDVEGAQLRNKQTGKVYLGDLNYDDNWGDLHIHIKKGLQHLDGQQAHDYVRYREDLEGDPGRIRRQQQLVRALAKEIMASSNFAKLGIINELQKQFDTDMTTKELASTAFFAKSLGDPGKIQPITLFGLFTSRGNFTLNHDKNVAIMRVVFGNTFDPENFLPNSPSTEGDEIGKTNNSNPGSMEILREAGLISDGKGGIKQIHVASLPGRAAVSGPSVGGLQVESGAGSEPSSSDPSSTTAPFTGEDPASASQLEPGSDLASPAQNMVSSPASVSRPHRNRHHRHHVEPSDLDRGDSGSVPDAPVRSE